MKSAVPLLRLLQRMDAWLGCKRMDAFGRKRLFASSSRGMTSPDTVPVFFWVVVFTWAKSHRRN